ncbi:hypothetical protein KEM60_02232 [Austwickia sp. TVS 96-490-7B]|uniref:RNA polymerase sigma factor n=1 Tax=Austwickia sp. TVS 96-490-7B TaxID=2830843 RepID=UPI001C59810F|nr:sigma-70 family RNA polymerase sigma factor [Austwickia sp. TVS 96-490-7B]MBW3086021.1 hypothetical protein [Austwickia sp. TVS 96-490-7B]
MPAAATTLGQRAGAILRDVRAGDGERMIDLVELVTPLLWQVARSAGLDAATAEDAVQQAWLHLVEHQDDVHDPDAVVGWLLTTVRRESWRLMHRCRRTLSSDDSALSLDGRPVITGSIPVDPQERAVANVQADRLWMHVRQLSPRCQALLRVICFADRPDYASISQSLGMPVGSIGPTRGRCLATLRSALLADPTWSAP